MPAALVLCLPPLQGQISTDEVFPGATWEYVSKDNLAAYGWSDEALQKTTNYIRDESNTTGLMVIDRGRVVYRYGDIEELSYLASARKSILSMLYGSWVENGTIKLEATLEELNIDDVGGLLPIEKKARVVDLISARSGVFHDASNGFPLLSLAPPRGSVERGTYWLYSNWDFNLAGGIFEQLTGRDIYDELQAQLALPLQFEDWNRNAQRKFSRPAISKYDAYHMWLSTRDMARLGYLMLHEGTWNGRQVFSPHWARTIVSVVTPVQELNPVRQRDGYFGYGYMWWVWDGPKAVGPFKGAYTAQGAFGQWLTVFPSLRMVVAHKTKSVYGRETSSASYRRIVELLFDAKGVTMTEPYPWAPSAGTAAAVIENASDYTGSFSLTRDLSILVMESKGVLSLQATAQPRFALKRKGRDEFAVVDGFVPVGISFERDSHGKVVAFVLHQNGINQRAPRTPKPALSPEKLADYTGKFSLNSQETLTVTVNGDKLFVQITGQPKLEIFSSSRDEFFLKVRNAQLRFQRSADGKVNAVVLSRSDGRDQRAEKQH